MCRNLLFLGGTRKKYETGTNGWRSNGKGKTGRIHQSLRTLASSASVMLLASILAGVKLAVLWSPRDLFTGNLGVRSIWDQRFFAPLSSNTGFGPSLPKRVCSCLKY